MFEKGYLAVYLLHFSVKCPNTWQWSRESYLLEFSFILTALTWLAWDPPEVHNLLAVICTATFLISTTDSIHLSLW